MHPAWLPILARPRPPFNRTVRPSPRGASFLRKTQITMNASSRVLAPIGCALAVFFTINKASAQTLGDASLLASAPSVQLTDNGYTPGFGAGYDVTLSQGTAYAEATVPALQFFNTNNSMCPTLDLYCVEISQYSASGTYQVVPLQNACHRSNQNVPPRVESKCTTLRCVGLIGFSGRRTSRNRCGMAESRMAGRPDFLSFKQSRPEACVLGRCR